jgi:transcriptional regulator with XRE-family HTH domain
MRNIFKIKGVIKINEELNSINIGNRIKFKMKELKLKQTDLVNITGISKTAISNYILGNRIPDTKSIYLISNTLKISIEWLLIGKEEIKDLNEDEKNLLKKYNLLTERNKGKVETFIDERLQEQKTIKEKLQEII